MTPKMILNLVSGLTNVYNSIITLHWCLINYRSYFGNTRHCTQLSCLQNNLIHFDDVPDREDDDDGDDDQAHVEGLQFIAEKDMKSLHRVSFIITPLYNHHHLKSCFIYGLKIEPYVSVCLSPYPSSMSNVRSHAVSRHLTSLLWKHLHPNMDK